MGSYKNIVPGVPKSGKVWKQGKNTAVGTQDKDNIGLNTSWETKMK